MYSSPSTLMHPVEANNHRKSGFFPTDSATIDKILSKINVHKEPMNILDPCCGEGLALSQFGNYFHGAKTFGVELDAERYEIAKRNIDHAYYADMYDVSFGRNFDLLFLNPPYGNDLTDSLSDKKTQRLEHKFLTQTFSSLKADGILVYVVPHKSIDEPRIKWLLARFKNLTVVEAAVDTYKQVVIIGAKLKHQRGVNAQMVSDFTKSVEKSGEDATYSQLYNVPSSNDVAKIRVKRLNAIGVSEVVEQYKGQWNHFHSLFSEHSHSEFKQPLHALSDWHLALLITSGAVQGVVDNGERKLLVKGTTQKRKQLSHSQTVDNDTVTTISESKDQFSAQIKAIDIDKNSPCFGDVITIR